MSWVRLDDGAPGHRKIVGLSDAAFRLWIVGLTHCNQQANDGRFSAHAARIMFGYLASPELGKGAAAELVAADLWAPTDEGYEVRNYLEYQPSKAERDSTNKAAAERMRAMRARRYPKPSDPANHEDVREPLRCNNGETSDELPAKFALPDPVPSRPDPVFKEKDSCVTSEPTQPELELVPQQAADANQKPKEPSKAQIQAQVALGLFAELVAARMSVIAGAEQLQPRPAAIAGLKACLGQGYTPDQIRHVIKLKVAEVKADPEQAKWFVPTWFRPANVERYLALKEADVARKPRGQAPQAMRPPEPPKSACNPPGGIDFKALREKVESQRTPEGDAKIKAELDIILGRSS